ncbi:MAG: peptide/nickel transport system permease protein, partial [Gammaproteobacteria bacterium]|nr:peptide/nickel transport system permease protein [Gammaproteobacteria bacterium]
MSPVATLICRRMALGVLTLFLVTVLVFVATEVLPGDAARVVLGRGANETTVQALRVKL